MKPDLLSFSPFRLDTTNQVLWQGLRSIALTPKAFVVLRYLMERQGRLVTKEELLNAAWPGIYVSDAALKVCIRRIRQALGDVQHPPQYIETVHWRGYRFIGDIELFEPNRNKEETGDWRLEASPPSPPVSDFKPLASNGTASFSPPVSGPQPLASSLVGREAEMVQLDGWLEKALQGERQIIFVTGEPGIGKTAIVETFLTRAATRGDVWTARGQCVAHYGTGEAYLPMLEALERLCRAPGHERLTALLNRHAPRWLAQMPELLGAGDRKRLRRELQGGTRERMLREMAEAVEALTDEMPLILVLEDLYWSDYATLDLLSFLAQRREPARLLIVGTYRPAEVTVGGHPLKTLKHELQAHGQCAELPLSLLTEDAVAAYVTTRFPELPVTAALTRLIHHRTDGNPLFMVSVVDYLVRQGFIVRQGQGWRLAGELNEIQIEVPSSIQQVIETQIDRLKPEEQRLLEVASVAGVEFSAAAAAAGLEAEIMDVEELCAGLARHGQFLRAQGVSEWPDGTVAARYEFIHALYQQVWYERVTAGRRMRLHQRIGERGERAYGNQVSEIAAELAVHFEYGRDHHRAVQYCQQAAKNAVRLCAYHEAITHLTKGLELLKTLPDFPERLQQEISLQISLGLSLVATKGYAFSEVEKSYTRALELCQHVEAAPQQYWALWGLQGFYYVRAELQQARTLGEQLFALAQRLEDEGLLGVAHFVLGATLFSLGELPAARDHLEQALALCNAQRHGRLRAICLAFTGRVLWTLGYPDQALQRNLEARALARELGHPLASVVTSCLAALLRIVRGEVPEAQQRAEETMKLSVERGFPHWEAQAMAIRGWALAQQGQEEEGIAQIHEGIRAYQETGAQLGRSMLLGLLAQTYRNMGRLEEGLTLAEEALALARATGQQAQEVWLSWLKGEFLLEYHSPKVKRTTADSRSSQGNCQTEAEAHFQHALDLARRQQAKSLELQVVIRLSRLWQQQGKKAQARQMLTEIYSWFTEGFDTVDLREARTLLEELRS